MSYTIFVIVLSIVLLIYWIFLLFKYEYDKKMIVNKIDEEYLFNQFNPLLAGCIADGRQIIARDIIAVILNLIRKKHIKLEVIPNKNDDPPKYQISINDEDYFKMDEIESHITYWLFQNDRNVDLVEALETLAQSDDANEKIAQLEYLCKDKLTELGTNVEKVPKGLRIINTIIFIYCIIVVIGHILMEKISLDITTNIGAALFSSTMLYVYGLIAGIFFTIFLVNNILRITLVLKNKAENLIRTYTGKKIYIKSILITCVFAIIVCLTIFTQNTYLIADELLICIALIIMVTDNLMLKNDVKALRTYSELHALKINIETSYNEVNDAKLEEYFVYAISFGNYYNIAMKVISSNSEFLKSVCKPYVMEYIITNYYVFYKHIGTSGKYLIWSKKTNSTMFKTIDRFYAEDEGYRQYLYYKARDKYGDVARVTKGLW